MEHPEKGGTLQEDDEQGADHGVGIDAGPAHALDVVPAEAVEALHDQDPPGYQFGVGTGDHHGLLARAGQHGGDVEHVVRFEAEVELLDDGLGEQLHQCRRVGQGRHRDAADEVGGEPAHGGDVPFDQAGHLGPLHLDHDLFARAQAGGMDLGDRCRGYGRGLEVLEHGVEGPAQVGFDHLADDLEALRRHPVPQQPELVDQFGREHALPGGEDLAELDVRRPQVLERPPQAVGQARPGYLGAAETDGDPFFDQAPGHDGPAQHDGGEQYTPPGGKARRRNRRGTWRAVAERSVSTSSRHGRPDVLPVRTHGGSSLKAPNERSDGGPGRRPCFPAEVIGSCAEVIS